MPLDTTNQGIMAQAMAWTPEQIAELNKTGYEVPTPAAKTSDTTPPPSAVPPDFFSTIGPQISKALRDVQTAEEAPLPNPPPPLYENPPPTQAPYNPIHAWGSTAMFLAGIGSLLTRTPLTTALNAAGGVLTAYKQQNQEQAAAAMESWKAQTANALNMQKYEFSMYNDALKAHGDDVRAKTAALQAIAGSIKDAPVLAALQIGGVPAVMDLLNKRKKAATSVAATSAYLQTAIDEEAAWKQYQQQNPPPKDPKLLPKWQAQTQAAKISIFHGSIQQHNDNTSDPGDIIDPVTGYSPNQYLQMAQITAKGGKPPEFGEGKLAELQKHAYEVAYLKVQGQQPTDSGGISKDPLAAYQSNRYADWIPAYVLNGFSKQYLPPLSYSGNASDKAIFDQGVQNFMAAYNLDPIQLSSRQATVKALNGSMSKLTAQYEQAVASESAFSQQWDYIKKNYLSKGAPPTNLGPMVNNYIQGIDIGTGDPNTVAYVTALGTLAEEYAKVISGSTGAQGSTVNAQEFARGLFQNGYSIPQITAAIESAKANMSAKAVSYPQQIEQVQTWINALPGTDGAMPSPAPAQAPGDTPAPAANPSAPAPAPGTTLHYDQKGNLVQ